MAAIRNRFGSFLPDLCGTRILVVDDYPDTLYLLKRVLEYCGAEVTATASADEALRALDLRAPHVLVSDLALPGRDGLWLIQEVRRRSPAKGGRTLAIGMTAYSEQYARAAALTAGFQEFVAKPVDVERLCLTVARLVGFLRQEQEKAGRTACAPTAGVSGSELAHVGNEHAPPK